MGIRKLTIFCDGGARGNPGPAAIAFVVVVDGKILYKFAKAIGRATNNVAEYRAVIEALNWLKENPKIIHSPLSILHFYLDSQLIVNQLRGFYKIKDAKLRNLIIKIRGLEQEIGGKIFYHLVPRAKNQLADSLVNQILK